MTILVSNDELAKDVVGAEALLERHRVRFTYSLRFSSFILLLVIFSWILIRVTQPHNMSIHS